MTVLANTGPEVKPRARKPRPAPAEPLLTNGPAYATLSIPDHQGKQTARVYRVYPERDPFTGRRLPGYVKLWRRDENGNTTTYKVRRKADGKVSCTCKAGSYGLPCKHAKITNRLGIV